MANINFITAHDGFTLCNLVSYDERHNEANLEGNTDRDNNNRSQSYGTEEPTDDPMITGLHQRQTRSFLATVLLSQGVPVIRHGDEMERIQGGSNDTYYQDNEISWVSWGLNEQDNDLPESTRIMIWLRRGHPVLRRRRLLTGDTCHGRENELDEIK